MDTHEENTEYNSKDFTSILYLDVDISKVRRSAHDKAHFNLHVTDLDLITECDFLPNCARFPQNFCNLCGMQ